MPDLWFYMQMSPTGRWCPVVQAQRVETVTKEGVMRLKRVGVGPRVTAPVKVADEHKGMSLSQLHEIYGESHG